MPRSLAVTAYQVYVAMTSLGFNEWRQNILVSTQEQGTGADLRFVDDPAACAVLETVRDTGWSQVYLPAAEFPHVLELLRTEKPLTLDVYTAEQRLILRTGPERPGEEEPALVRPFAEPAGSPR